MIKHIRNERKIGAILSYIIVGINIAIGVLYTPILIRSLGQAEYGLHSLVASFMSYLTILDFGLGNAIIIYTSKFIAKKNKEEEYKLNGVLFIIYCIIGVISFILGMLLFFNLDLLFKETITDYERIEARKMILIMTINIALSFPLSVFSNICIAYEKFIFNKIMKIVQILTAPIITLPILFLYPKGWIVVLITAVINILVMIINAIYAFKKLKIHISFKNLDFSILKEIFSYSIYVFVNVIVDKINWSVDQVILGATSGTIAVAVYAVGAKINHLFNTMSTSLPGVILPKTAKMEEEKRPIEEFTNVFIQTGRIQFLILALIFTGFIIFGKVFIGFWAGKGYIDSYYIAIILMIGGFLPLIQNTGIGILQAKNKHKFRTFVIAGIAILNIALSIPMAKMYGGIGAAFGTLFALLLGQGIILNIYYKKVIGIDIPKFLGQILKMALPIVILAIPAYFVFQKLIPHTFVSLILSILIYTIIYLFIVWNFSMNDYEKGEVNKILMRLKLKKVKEEKIVENKEDEDKKKQKK